MGRWSWTKEPDNWRRVNHIHGRGGSISRVLIQLGCYRKLIRISRLFHMNWALLSQMDTIRLLIKNMKQSLNQLSSLPSISRFHAKDSSPLVRFTSHINQRVISNSMSPCPIKCPLLKTTWSNTCGLVGSPYGLVTERRSLNNHSSISWYTPTLVALSASNPHSQQKMLHMEGRIRITRSSGSTVRERHSPGGHPIESIMLRIISKATLNQSKSGSSWITRN